MKEYSPVLQDEGSELIEIRTSASSFSILPWLPLLCMTLLSIVLMVTFGMFSTLYIYLAYLAVYSIAGFCSILDRLLSRQRKMSMTPAMGAAMILLFLPPYLVPSPPLTTIPRLLTSPYAPRAEPTKITTTTTLTNDDVLFVAANLYNSEDVLPSFSRSLLRLADSVGRDNIFISIYESNSEDGTKDLLTSLDLQLTQLNISHSIKLADTHNHVGVHGEWARIEFLAELRNKVYEALDDGQPGAAIKSRIRRVLWLNDIFFEAEAALRLLDTNQGKYDVACGLDFQPLGIYDTWVMRDIDRHRQKPVWPYFNNADDVARLRLGELIPMKSCWNGIVAYDADILIDTGRQAPSYSQNRSRSDVIWPLRFRKSGECLTSECLSINYDLHLLLKDEREPAIFINPTVEVAYTKAMYFLYTSLMHWRIVVPWRLLWEDWISYRLLGFITDVGRKPANCASSLEAGFSSFRNSRKAAGLLLS